MPQNNSEQKSSCLFRPESQEGGLTTADSSNTNSGKFGNSGSSSKPSQSAFIKESWGTRENFQHSYGLKSKYLVLSAWELVDTVRCADYGMLFQWSLPTSRRAIASWLSSRRRVLLRRRSRRTADGV